MSGVNEKFKVYKNLVKNLHKDGENKLSLGLENYIKKMTNEDFQIGKIQFKVMNTGENKDKIIIYRPDLIKYHNYCFSYMN